MCYNGYMKYNKGFLSIGLAIIVGIAVVGVVAGIILHKTDNFGATIPVPVALFETSLQAGITSSATSMTLISTSTEDGTNLTDGTVYGFIVDEGSPSEEFVLGTASSSKIVSMTRGVSVITGNTSVAALQEAHRRGASVKITSAPVLLVLSRIMNGDETIPNLLSYTATTTPTLDTHLVHKYYVDSLTAAGASVADESTAGIGMFSTQADLIIGTATSSYAGTTYSLFPQNKYFNATQSATTTVPVTGTNGKLSQAFLDLTEAWTFSSTTIISGAFTASGNNTLSGTTTISGDANFTGNVSGVSKFGGDGSDGALIATTTVLDLTSSSTKMFQFSSLDMTGTSTITFTNPHASGTVVIFKVSGNANIACTSAPCIDLQGLGAATSTNPNFILDSGAVAYYGSMSTGGGQYDADTRMIYTNADNFWRKIIAITPGAAGSDGEDGLAGGRGGGAFYMEVGNVLTFTVANGIQTAGVKGTNGNGAGGGGAGGACLVLYNNGSPTGTCNDAGGNGGTGSGTNKTAGGGGGSVGGAGGASPAASDNLGGGGGANWGAAGESGSSGVVGTGAPSTGGIILENLFF